MLKRFMINSRARLHMNKFLNAKSGFTLPELLLVAAILAYALSMILLTFIKGVALNEDSRNLITATSHAEYVMENIKNTAFYSITTFINGKTWTWNTAGVSAQGLTPLNNESVTTLYSGSNPLDITVAVNWRNTGGRSRAKVLRTLISG